jgi:hypothetical protein
VTYYLLPTKAHRIGAESPNLPAPVSNCRAFFCARFTRWFLPDVLNHHPHRFGYFHLLAAEIGQGLLDQAQSDRSLRPRHDVLVIIRGAGIGKYMFLQALYELTCLDLVPGALDLREVFASCL